MLSKCIRNRQLVSRASYSLSYSLEANTLEIFKSNYELRRRQYISEHIRQRILLIIEPEPESKRHCFIKLLTTWLKYPMSRF